MKIISRVLESEAWVRQLYLFGFGIYLLLFPSLGLRLLFTTVVGLLAILGVYNIVRFVLSKEKKPGYTSYALLGAFQLVLALFLYLNLTSAIKLSIYLFAFFSLFNGALNFKDYLEQREVNALSSKISLLLMGLNFALALILVASPFSYVASKPVVVGLALIGINGIDLYKEKYMDHKKMTVTETPEGLEEQEEMDI